MIEGDNFMHLPILRNIFIMVLVYFVSPMPPALADDISGSDRVMCAVQMDNFKRAFSVCLEAKNYMVK